MKVILFSLLILATPLCMAQSTELVSPEQVKQSNQDFRIIDVRSLEEYNNGHVPGALNIPHHDIANHAGLLPADTEQPVVLYCRSGRRAGLAASELKKMGYNNLFLMQGDMPAWREKGFDIAHD
ncbi:rhodanese-like domain-containing protein [Lacimicrobium alkaliphilum]|nr:rhodanese-like domain-containing protein [Lacimicrobium alkaliphilum]